MSTPPLLIALADQDALRLISQEFASQGRAHHVTTDGAQLMEAIQGPTDIIVDPEVAPSGLTAESFITQLVAKGSGGRTLALSGGALAEDTLMHLGVTDVFGLGTSPLVVARRLGNAAIAETGATGDADQAAGTDVGAGGLVRHTTETDGADTESQDKHEKAVAAFTERVSTRLSRARDREKAVALLAVSIRGLNTPDPKRDFREVIETVLEDLDQTQEVSYSASRMIITALGEGIYGVLVPDVERVQDAARLAVRLHEAMALIPGVTNHIGIACSPDDGTVATELIGRATDAVKRARRGNENNVEFFSESMSRWAFERLTLEQSLRDALRNRELVVYYQPRIDIESRQIIGMEALVRWIHPQFGLVSPAQFIPLAEETGLIVPIGEWILREACRQNAEWRSLGLPRIRVSVNLSPVQFRQSTLHESVCAALDDVSLDADGLELEVTESLLMNDPAETAAILGRLKARGIHISIDDFGTGYSSLSYLKRFPINALKIDRSFVTDVTSNPDDAAIATAIILMGHSLKLTVVAEGVETENQLAFLKVLQCNEVQGYLFSPPVPADRAQVFLEDQRDGRIQGNSLAA